MRTSTAVPAARPRSLASESIAPAAPEQYRELDRLAKDLVQDLHTPSPAVFWTDLLGSALLGWGAFVVAVQSTPWSPLMLLAVSVAAMALYRGLCFIHEITHIRPRALPGFETTWNLLFGVGLLLPSLTYVGVHHSHHAPATYGTCDDPEYLPFARSRTTLITFALQSSFLIPVLLLVRFLLLSPIGWLFRSVRQWLDIHASSFAMNPVYRRRMLPAASQRLRRWEVVLFIGSASAATLIFFGVIPLRTFWVWYAVLTIVSFVNTLRVLAAHRYESDGTPGDRTWQLVDSIDTPGGPWTVLWAPVGLRYHAMHHYFPGIPYHNLGKAYRRITGAEPATAAYGLSTGDNLLSSLVSLYRKTGRT